MAGLVGDWHQLSGVVADRIAVPPEMAGAFPDALWLLPFRPRTFLPGLCLPSGTQPQLARTEDRARKGPALLVHLATSNGVVWPADLKLWVKLMGKLPSSSVIALAGLPGTRTLIPPLMPLSPKHALILQFCVWVAAESEEGLRLLWAKQGGRQAALRFGNLTSVAQNNATLFLDTTAASSAFETAISLCSGAPTVLSLPNRADPGEMRGPTHRRPSQHHGLQQVMIPGASAHSRAGASMLLPPTAPSWLASTLARTPADFINVSFPRQIHCALLRGAALCLDRPCLVAGGKTPRGHEEGRTHAGEAP
jgi:hypothetical protein